jgi:hypothetical protein
MTAIVKFTIVEYEQHSELLKLLEGDHPRCDARKLSLIKNLNYTMNQVKRLMAHV